MKLIAILALLPIVCFSQTRKDYSLSKNWYCACDISKVYLNDTVRLMDKDSAFKRGIDITRFFAFERGRYRRVIKKDTDGGISDPEFYPPERWRILKKGGDLIMKMYTRKYFFEKYLIVYKDTSCMTIVLVDRWRRVMKTKTVD